MASVEQGRTSIRHTYVRPVWQCERCDEPWPCAQRRAIFLEKYAGRRSLLQTLMGTFLIDATADLVDPIEQLQERFVGWTRSGSRA